MSEKEFRQNEFGQKFPDRGPEAYLSPEERQFMQRLFSFPEDFPPKFRSWVEQHLAVNGSFTRGQVEGLTQFDPRAATPIAGLNESTTSTTYTNLTTVGPELTGIGKGDYLLLFGSQVVTANNGEVGLVSVSINGVAAADSDALIVGSPGSTINASSMRVVAKELALASNSITMKYRSSLGNAVFFQNRWLFALKTGN